MTHVHLTSFVCTYRQYKTKTTVFQTVQLLCSMNQICHMTKRIELKLIWELKWPSLSVLLSEILLVADLVLSFWGTLFWASVRLMLFLSCSLCVGSCWRILCLLSNADAVCAARPAAHRPCASCTPCIYYVHLYIRVRASNLFSYSCTVIVTWTVSSDTPIQLKCYYVRGNILHFLLDSVYVLMSQR